MKKYRILIFSLLGLLAIGGFYLLFFRNSGKTVTTYTTASVRIASISNTVTATGTVEPLKQVEVGTQVSGVIKKIYVDYNSIVKKGQLLAELDKTPLLAQLASSKADLESAASSLTFQEANFKRINELFEKKAVSETDYESALYQYSNAKANFAKMSSEVNKAKTNLGYTMIYSPIDGVVLSRAVDEGQTVAASFSTPTLFTIAQDLTKMQVVANVDEADIGQLEEGQKVTFTVDAYPDDNFTGTVKQVRLLAVTNSNVVTYSVVIDAPNPRLKLKPGLTASIIAYTKEATNVLTLPAKALRFTPDSTMLALYRNKLNKQAPAPTASLGTSDLRKEITAKDPIIKKLIWVKTGDSIQPRYVTTGLSDETNVEIKSGLKDGELVVVSMEQLTAKAAKTVAASTSSPFMPKRPGQKK
jgi:HlyD family secretion protein